MKPKLEAYRANIEKQARLRAKHEADQALSDYLHERLERLDIWLLKKAAELAVAKANCIAAGHRAEEAALMARYGRFGVRW